MALLAHLFDELHVGELLEQRLVRRDLLERLVLKDPEKELRIYI